MGRPTYIPLATLTLTGSDSLIVFDSIPQIYRDLILISTGTPASGADALRFRFNGDTGNNYSFVRIWGENSSAFSSSATTNFGYSGDLPGTNPRFLSKLQIMDYSATDKHKTTLVNHAYDPSVASYNAFTTANRWANTSAITSISIFCVSSFNAGSTFSLYGIAS
jgi:hypothetical protein